MHKIIILLILCIHTASVFAKNCVYVSSYHQGYEWNDGIQKGIEDVLLGKCDLKIYYLDTKRNPGEVWARFQAKKVRDQILLDKPDVVIVSDDNASRYLVVPYFKNSPIPFVFCGLNWTMKEYNYPYRNATGMIEVAPIKPIIKQLRNIQPKVKIGLYLSSDVISEHKDYRQYKKIFKSKGIQLKAVFVKSFRNWINEYKNAQQYDFIFLGNNAGINDWFKPEAERVVRESGRKISLTVYKWMLPYSALALTKLPEEQGQWAAKVALSILNGRRPDSIPVVYNRHWDMWINTDILNRLKIRISYLLYQRAKHF